MQMRYSNKVQKINYRNAKIEKSNFLAQQAVALVLWKGRLLAWRYLRTVHGGRLPCMDAEAFQTLIQTPVFLN